tara:strand:- start:484 stop:843 length:360 start_codon:yes stop_codon:yes gene_type:complete
MFGKIKTTFQMFSIAVILLSFLMVSYKERGAINSMYSQAREEGIGPVHVAQANLQEFLAGNVDSVLYGLASFVPYYLMLFTTILTIISGIRYFVTNFRLFIPDRKKRRAMSEPAGESEP